MPAKMPISMGETRSNGAGQFVSLFFNSTSLDGGAASDQWYWLYTNSVAAILDERQNKIPVNGFTWWNELSGALANVPSGFGEVQQQTGFATDKILSYMNMFPFENGGDLGTFPNGLERTKSEYTEIAAAGVNCIVVPINWDDVFVTYAEQQANDSSKWARWDALVNHALSLNCKVSLRLVCNKDDGPHNDIDITNNSGFYGLSKNSKDQFGNVSRIDGGVGHVSLAYTDGVNQLLDFVQKALVRYQTIIGNKFRWVSVVLSSQNEIGYNYENQFYFGPKYPALFDYSSYSIEGFRTFLASPAKYNNSISALKSAWGTNFANFGAVNPPGQGLNGSTDQLAAIFRTVSGKDWYEWNEKLTTTFLQNVEAIIISNGITAKLCTETGSDTDDKSIVRLTANIKRWNQVGAMHKTQLGIIGRDTSFAHTVDYLRDYVNNGGVLGSEFSTADMTQQQSIFDAITMENTLVELAMSSRKFAGANEFIVISHKKDGYFNVAVNAARRMKVILETVNLEVSPNIPRVQWSLSQVLNNGVNYMRNIWAAAGGSANSRVNMVQVDSNTTPPSPTNCVFPYQKYALQNFCLSNGNLRASTYNHDFESVKNTHFLALVPTHSISYKDPVIVNGVVVNDELSLCDYKITGNNDGIVYVRNTQYTGYRNVGGAIEDNNHPRYYAENPVHFDDAVFVLPINQSYTIEFTSKTANAISATVEPLDSNIPSDNQIKYRRKLSTAETAVGSFSFDPATLGTFFIRQVKFNCNRFQNTDTEPNI